MKHFLTWITISTNASVFIFASINSFFSQRMQIFVITSSLLIWGIFKAAALEEYIKEKKPVLYIPMKIMYSGIFIFTFYHFILFLYICKSH